jgi:hypothetical protein
MDVETPYESDPAPYNYCMLVPGTTLFIELVVGGWTELMLAAGKASEDVRETILAHHRTRVGDLLSEGSLDEIRAETVTSAARKTLEWVIQMRSAAPRSYSDEELRALYDWLFDFPFLVRRHRKPQRRLSEMRTLRCAGRAMGLTWLKTFRVEASYLDDPGGYRNHRRGGGSDSEYISGLFARTDDEGKPDPSPKRRKGRPKKPAFLRARGYTRLTYPPSETRASVGRFIAAEAEFQAFLELRNGKDDPSDPLLGAVRRGRDDAARELCQVIRSQVADPTRYTAVEVDGAYFIDVSRDPDEYHIQVLVPERHVAWVEEEVEESSGG